MKKDIIKFLVSLILLGLLFAWGYNAGLNKTNEAYSYTDLSTIKNYLLDKTKLSDEQIRHLDINKDGRITSMDYVLMKNELIKIDSIKKDAS